MSTIPNFTSQDLEYIRAALVERFRAGIEIRLADVELQLVFFSETDEQFGTGNSRYGNLPQCLSALPQSQADHEREHQGIRLGATGANL